MPVTTLPDLTDKAACRRLVVKVGSALLVDSDGAPRQDWLASLVTEIARLRGNGQDVIVVSSGAIALGAAALSLPPRERRSLADAQAAASVGQIRLGALWSDLFTRHGITTAQILVTLEDLEDRRRYLNASATLERLLDAGAIPVVNENDSVATTEIRFGDNDRLAARVAQAAGADAVLLLSDVDGLYDRAPSDPEAQLIDRVDGVDDTIRAMVADGPGSGLGSGGMAAKVQAAQIAERAGIALGIVNGTHEAPVAKAIRAQRGTIFLPQRNDAARKSWLGGRLAARGRLHIDTGCAAALADGGSLLAAGITQVAGDFSRGDLVEIVAPDGQALAQGLSEYDTAQCRAILGLRADEQAAALGHAPRAAVVHRDHLVML